MLAIGGLQKVSERGAEDSASVHAKERAQGVGGGWGGRARQCPCYEGQREKRERRLKDREDRGEREDREDREDRGESGERERQQHPPRPP